MSLDLDDRTNCPLAGACACGATDGLEVATIATPVGVYCATICGACVETNHLLPLSWSQAIELVGKHCGHLGITVDDMADQLERAR